MHIISAEKIVNMNVNQNVILVAKMNAIDATLMEKNVLKIVKMQKILLELNVEKSAKKIK